MTSQSDFSFLYRQQNFVLLKNKERWQFFVSIVLFFLLALWRRAKFEVLFFRPMLSPRLLSNRPFLQLVDVFVTDNVRMILPLFN